MREGQAVRVPAGPAAPTGAGPGSRASLPAAATARLRLLWRWWEARPAVVRDREFALVFTVLSFTPPLSLIGAQFGDLPVQEASVASVLLTLGQTLPVAVRTRWPAACLAMTGASFAVHQSLGAPTTFGSLGLYIALYSVGAHQERFRQTVPLTATGGCVLFCVVLHLLGSPTGPIDFLLIYLVLVTVWGLGALARRQRRQEAARRRLTAQVAIAEERSRMARELHDVVTHHVTAMVVQSGAAQYLTQSPDRLNDALHAINGSGRRALAELRFLLGVLEATGESRPEGSAPPVPGLVPDLVEQIRAGGQPVELIEEGRQPDTAVGARLAAYRIVQESLTNAVKYAPGRRTLVRLAHTPDWTEVEVTTAGAGDSTAESVALRDGGPHVSGGRGLTGLRERVEALGGEFAAGFRPEGGFRVHARIPAGGTA
ncbi:sensor histidine kinase [Streptomyces sp. NBC_00334]|uniref:sensor histidine kinase n=1 Tax=Streptomyces sp. NBC_00334 TaxID=2975713 RepID=UPI002E2AD486|nr:histidine kinase [Streptomyces sp. NBC_00334]